jgi:hypothetical protein
LKKLWETRYKKEIDPNRVMSPEPPAKMSYIKSILNDLAPIALSRPKPTARRDQLFLYLNEAPQGEIGVMDYWRIAEVEWPELAHIAFDFMAIPAMSSECERVFSLCAKLTTPESSRLSGKMLWHTECLNNWQRRGAIMMATASNAILLDLS